MTWQEFIADCRDLWRLLTQQEPKLAVPALTLNDIAPAITAVSAVDYDALDRADYARSPVWWFAADRYAGTPWDWGRPAVSEEQWAPVRTAHERYRSILNSIGSWEYTQSMASQAPADARQFMSAQQAAQSTAWQRLEAFHASDAIHPPSGS